MGSDGDFVDSWRSKARETLEDEVYDLGDNIVLFVSTQTAPNRSPLGGIAPRTRLPRPTGLPERDGRLLPVLSASAFGRALSDFDLNLDARSGRVVSLTATNRLVDASDPMIEGAIRPAV